MIQEKKDSVAIFWFRRDLRLEDNCGLSQALAKHQSVLPIFIFDRNILDSLNDRQDKRVTFIYKTLEDLRAQLKAYASDLWTIYATPQEAFTQLKTQFQIEAVYANGDYEPDAIKRDHLIGDLLSQSGIPFFGYKDQVIFERNDIVTDSNQPYKVYTPFKNKWLAKLEPHHYASYEASFASLYQPSNSFLFPSLEAMGFHVSAVQFPETTLNEELIKYYDQKRDYPALDATSKLSVHLRFGTISIRKLVSRARQLNTVWLQELIWREFFMQTLFHFPDVTHQSFRPKYDNIPWRNNREEFERWCNGQTGYPIVDAGMRELNETGFMHNRVRMIVASFLCKHLLIHWSWGERYFAEKLLDFDLSANNGNWQWAAGTGCDAAPYFRVFNPWTQTKKFDPELRYTKKWVPEVETVSYPHPMIDHSFARKRAIETYKKGLGNA